MKKSTVVTVNTSKDLNLQFALQNFRGNQDSTNPMTHRLAEPIMTRTIRVKPQRWSPVGACLRLELFGCEDGEYRLLTSAAAGSLTFGI